MAEVSRCPVEATVDVIGGKWKPTILFHLKEGPRRFNELRRLMPHVTQRMLTLQLRALEEDGIVERTVHDCVPPRVEYAFSERGLTLGPLLDAMERWGEAHGTRWGEAHGTRWGEAHGTRWGEAHGDRGRRAGRGG